MNRLIEKRHAYGVIPIIGTPDRFEILLIEQRDAVVKNYWTFPKGTPEHGESSHETAVRETREEVGVVCEEIDPEFSFTDEYTFMRDGKEIQKSVTYFVGRAPSRAYTLQEIEVVRAEWCTFAEAMKRMKYKGGNKVLQALVESAAPARLLSPKSL